MCFLFYSQFLQLIIIWHGANITLKMISGIFSKKDIYIIYRRNE